MSMLKIFVRDQYNKILVPVTVEFWIDGEKVSTANSDTGTPSFNPQGERGATLVKATYEDVTQQAVVGSDQQSFTFTFEVTDPAPSPKVPKWFPIAGMLFGALTLLFFMALVFVGDTVAQSCGSRFPIMVVFSLGVALSASFLGGTAAADGTLPMPLLKEHPLQFSVAGGIAVLVISMLLANLLLPTPNCGSGFEPETETKADLACFYFDSDSAAFEPLDSEFQSSQLAELNSHLNDVEAITLVSIPGQNMPRELSMAIGEQRLNSVKNYLAENGIERSRIDTLSFGKETGTTLTRSPQLANLNCAVRVLKGSSKLRVVWIIDSPSRKHSAYAIGNSIASSSVDPTIKNWTPEIEELATEREEFATDANYYLQKIRLGDVQTPSLIILHASAWNPGGGAMDAETLKNFSLFSFELMIKLPDVDIIAYSRSFAEGRVPLEEWRNQVAIHWGNFGDLSDTQIAEMKSQLFTIHLPQATGEYQDAKFELPFSLRIERCVERILEEPDSVLSTSCWEPK